MAQHDAADEAKTSKAADSEPVAPAGDHDRVVMLTLNPDGSPRQDNPEIIGDKQFAVDAAKRQFAEQAVSAVDSELRGVTPDSPSERDPDKLKPAHDKAEQSAHARAEQVVGDLHRGVGD